jgi:hypothetical protein
MRLRERLLYLLRRPLTDRDGTPRSNQWVDYDRETGNFTLTRRGRHMRMYLNWVVEYGCDDEPRATFEAEVA